MRPSEVERPEEVIPEPEPVRAPDPMNIVAIGPAGPHVHGEKCAYASCQNIARDGSKYCSRACSNRNARKRHKERRHAA